MTTFGLARRAVSSAGVLLLLFALSGFPTSGVHADDDRTEIEVSLVLWRQPGGPCDATWREEFRAAQRRDPEDQDCLDRVWSLNFWRNRGRQPTDADWQRYYYLVNPAPLALEDPDQVDDEFD